MIASAKPPEPKAVVCSFCGKKVVPQVVPDQDSSGAVHRDVSFGHVERPPETTHFHAECPICHHPLYAQALENLNLESGKSIDWQMIILSLVALAALGALAFTMSR